MADEEDDADEERPGVIEEVPVGRTGETEAEARKLEIDAELEAHGERNGAGNLVLPVRCRIQSRLAGLF
jgi:hypothetical protein